jgi:predicted Fe-Mo cluster-binding NifX family protein
MKIAVTYEDGEVFRHFGRTPQFKVYEITDGTIVSSEVVDTDGTGHGALAGFIKNLDAKVLICGGIGGGAQMAMEEAGVRLFAGASGNADDAVKAYLNGTLPEIGEATCNHHEHEHHEGHDCSHGGKCHG